LFIIPLSLCAKIVNRVIPLTSCDKEASVSRAGVFNHLKPCDGKEEGIHSFGKIDCVYLINLDDRTEKLERSLKQCKDYNINPYRFSAINGQDLSLEEMQDIGFRMKRGVDAAHLGKLLCNVYLGGSDWIQTPIRDPKQIYFGYYVAKGPIGVILSHLSILQDAYDSGYQVIWVMEDDIRICNKPELILRGINKLNQIYGLNGWDILFTDPDGVNRQGKRMPCRGVTQRPNKPTLGYKEEPREVIEEGSNITTISHRYGTYSMVINRSGIEKILHFYNENDVFWSYDLEMSSFMSNLKKFAFDSNVVSHLAWAESDNY